MNFWLTALPHVCLGRSNQSQACSRALQALRSVRQHFDRESRIENEQRKKFSPYTSVGRTGKGKGRAHSCSFKMFCLSSPLDTHVPSTIAYKETLCKAGLGEKTVVVPNALCSRDEFWSVITSAYPKLLNCGGFELLRCMTNSRELEPISRSVAKSPKLIKSVLSNRKIFIRPLQKDLDIGVMDDGVSADDSFDFFVSCKFDTDFHCQIYRNNVYIVTKKLIWIHFVSMLKCVGKRSKH